MDDENNPENPAVTTEVDTTTPTPPAIGDTTPDTSATDTTADTTPASTEPDWKAQAENYKRALAQEREARKRYQRDLAERGTGSQGNPQGDTQDVYSHPEFQKLLIKQAETELKEGAQEILDQYPNIPQNIKKAILKNPRGYVSPTTTTVPLALIDIQDYLEEINAEFGEGSQSAPSVRTVNVMGNNGSTKAADPDETLAAEAMKTPPEEWTDEQEAAVARLTAKRRK